MQLYKLTYFLKRAIAACLMMLAGSAWAEWVIHSKGEENTFYFDPTTIRKDGNMRRVWEVRNLRTRDENGEMSYRARYEFDCKQERFRFLAISGHTEPMAGGKTLNSFGEDNNWRAIAPGTIVETLLNIVCAK